MKIKEGLVCSTINAPTMNMMNYACKISQVIIHKSEISIHYCILIKINKNQLLSDVPTLSLDSLHREMNSLTDRRADRQTNRRTNRQTNKQTD